MSQCYLAIVAEKNNNYNNLPSSILNTQRPLTQALRFGFQYNQPKIINILLHVGKNYSSSWLHFRLINSF